MGTWLWGRAEGGTGSSGSGVAPHSCCPFSTAQSSAKNPRLSGNYQSKKPIREVQGVCRSWQIYEPGKF